MSDRELLEKAARAAGYCQLDGHDEQMLDSGWNPLKNDGDAFRLMTDLRMCIEVSDDDGGFTRIIDDVGDVILRFVNFGNDLKATRRAIVRAAAAMVD